LHFLAAGAALFLIDLTLANWRGNPNTIEVPESVYREARALVAANLNREASEADLTKLIDRWVDNEVLYRQGLALGLDKGDSAIRDRVIFKSLGVTQAGLRLPAYNEATLRAWFDKNHERYDAPTRYDFLEAVVSSDRTTEKLSAFVLALNGRGTSDAESSLNVFRDRPRANLEQSYGPEFLSGLERAQAKGPWMLLPSKAGLRVVQLQEIKPGSVATYESVRDRILQDWKDETMAQLTTQAVRELGRKYRVVREGAGS
jgi:hypothetical protein